MSFAPRPTARRVPLGRLKEANQDASVLSTAKKPGALKRKAPGSLATDKKKPASSRCTTKPATARFGAKAATKGKVDSKPTRLTASQKLEKAKADAVAATTALNKLQVQHDTLTGDNAELSKELERVGVYATTLQEDAATVQLAHQEEAAKMKTSMEDMDGKFAAHKAEAASKEQQAELDISARNARISTLEGDLESTKAALAEAEATIRSNELERRRLHNTIQELKGNIRVFCRVRPSTAAAESIQHIKITAPDKGEDAKELDISVSGKKVSGEKTNKKVHFGFDRVFGPSQGQTAVFAEISQLVQSALDGYNITIFAYGQTGSGKTYTMEGGESPETKGLIPRSMDQIFDSAEGGLKAKGWEYEYEASFLEIYNETIRDLLCEDTATSRLDVKQGKETISVPGLTIVPVQDADSVDAVLAKANSNRAIAATEMNARSSRSHSVFQLRITGRNTHSQDTCSAMVNLVDLAGSERLEKSQAQGDRLKETQSINKSLSNLGVVITSLGNKDKHVPYRNSKLTHLLKPSLEGDSKCLMFVNVAAEEASTNETLCSLRFATKVNACQVGTARTSK